MCRVTLRIHVILATVPTPVQCTTIYKCLNAHIYGAVISMLIIQYICVPHQVNL